MTAYSTIYSFEICPNCDELNNTPAYEPFGPFNLKMDASEGTP